MLSTFDDRIYRGEDEEDIVKSNLIMSLQKQADEENFPKSVIGGLFDYYGISPKKKTTR